MAKLVAADTETTKLGWDRRIWEVGLITRPDHRSAEGEQEHRWFIDRQDLDLGNADLISLNIGGYYERHPQEIIRGPGQPPAAELGKALAQVARESDVIREVERLCRGAHILGNVVNFDTEALAARGRANNVLWSGHYHVLDCENLAVGYLRGLNAAAAAQRAAGWEPGFVPPVPDLPWNSEELSAAIGIKPPEKRHEALADALWALDMYDKVMGIA